MRHLSPKIGDYISKMAPVWVEGQLLNVKRWKHLVFVTLRDTDQNMSLRPAELEFHYRDAFADVAIPEAYERLLQDALHGDASLFMRSDEIERAWEVMGPFLAAAERPDAPRPEEYAPGSQGPGNADEFLARDGRAWLTLCQH